MSKSKNKSKNRNKYTSKSKKKKSKRQPQQFNRPRPGCEWVGGLLRAPFLLEDRTPSYRPLVVFWLELPVGVIVSTGFIDPEESRGAVGNLLQQALDNPMDGTPRRPDRIRVATDVLAGEVRSVTGDTIPITTAPTPEMQAILESMAQAMAEDNPEGLVEESYLRGGEIPTEVVANMFTAAEELHRVAPWQTMTDSQVIRLDIPALDVEEACIAVIGNLGESLGLLIFPSIAGYEAFYEASLSFGYDEAPRDLGSGWLALNYERGAEITKSMRKEVATHGWPVASAEAFPQVDRIDRDLVRVPHNERDMKIVTCTAMALMRFYESNREIFEVDELIPVCDSFVTVDDIKVHLCAPFEDHGDLETSPSADPSVFDEPESQLITLVVRHATEHVGSQWHRFRRAFEDLDEAMELAVPWSLFDYQVGGTTALESYLAAHGRQLSTAVRAIAEAQQEAWLSVWEVTSIEPGVGLSLRDMLAEETRYVPNQEMAESLTKNDAILARLVEEDGVTRLSGIHPRPLPPLDAAEVVRLAKNRIRRKKAVPVERLRESVIGSYLIKKWEAQVWEMDDRQLGPQSISNMDGDPITYVSEHYQIEPGASPEVIARLEKQDWIIPPDPDFDDDQWTIIGPGSTMPGIDGEKVLGQIYIDQNELTLDTNSTERADSLRARLEEVCQGLFQHRHRECRDLTPEDIMNVMGENGPSRPDSEASSFELDTKNRYYEAWLDESIPALGGKTPRDAARTVAGRKELDLLLKYMENMEQRGSDNPFDFAKIRKTLKL